MCEKSFSRNAEQVCSPYLISLLLGGCRGVHTYIFDISTGVVRCVRMGLVWIWAYEFTSMGVLFFATGVLTYMYVRTHGHSTFTFSSNVLYGMYRHPVSVSCVNRLPMHTYVRMCIHVRTYILLVSST